MSTVMKTPGVYIQEKDAFGNSIVPVPTAVPVFIGYTEKTSYNGKKLVNKAVKCTSLADFLAIFGDSPPEVKFSLASFTSKQKYNALNSEAKASRATLAAATAAKANPPNGADTDALDQAEQDAQAAATKAQADLDALTGTELAALVAAEKALAENDDDAATAGLQTTVTATKGAMEAIWATTSFLEGDQAFAVTPTSVNYRLFSALKFFYQNGGGDCYVISTGPYDPTATVANKADFDDAMVLLEKEMEPTLLVIPDLMEIRNPVGTDHSTIYKDAYALQQEMINHCAKMMNRIAILDIPGGYNEPVPGQETSVQGFRNVVSGTDSKSNSYAAAYYPWLHTTVYQTGDISNRNFDTNHAETLTNLATLLTNEFTPMAPDVIDPTMAEVITSATTKASLESEDETVMSEVAKADSALKNLSSKYQLVLGKIQEKMNLMGPSSGMAGIYAAIDSTEGVWIAPANVSISSTVKPAFKIDHATQEDLNVPLSGKSVSAIRAFPGRGNLVWGARTLDGNSNDWRYINVRRTLIFIEQSVKEAAKAYVFAPNDASTWVNVQSMISNFLLGLWKQGGLVGPKPTDAFSVSVGLGSTMTGDDVLNGIMRVMVKVAVSRPAEFIEITFQQEMQKG